MATDGDLGTFGTITYELKGDDALYFQVGSATGNITVTKTLDYENKNVYQFLLHAKDGGGIDYKEAIATINVGLQDINDNDPVFTKSSYSRTISENQPSGTFVVDMTATDKDSGEYGRVSYRIISGNVGDAFTINGTGFVSTAKPLDREDKPTYNLEIKAYDHGSPTRNTTTELVVNVKDENDNAPYIIAGNYIVTNISEDAGGGTVVFEFIAAIDADAGDNRRLIYSMSGGDGRFILNSDTGRLQISPTGLDREIKSSYDLVINVTDRGSPPKFNSTTVHVNILDVNDNAPEFDPQPSQSPQSYIVTVNEGPNTINSTIVNINATDKDYGSNAEIRYSLTGDEHGFFQLNPVTGVLIAVKELARENPQMSKDASGKGRFFLDVTATDQAKPSDKRKSAVVRVTVSVDDKDSDYKGNVSYNITAGDPNGPPSLPEFEVRIHQTSVTLTWSKT
ncbi:hypothetical protein QZH41_006357 [Actinostola sp. cb2023]|nr:hypothetical protein QZH41_006357 [Actinostola sp. cb2023]